MLKTGTQTRQAFFEMCLGEVGGFLDRDERIPKKWLDIEFLQPQPPFAVPAQQTSVSYELTQMQAMLRDTNASAEWRWLHGKPEMTEAEAERGGAAAWQAWNEQWANWANARRPAFFARAALALLGDRAALDYLLDQMRASDNIVFQAVAFDALQYATGRYLTEAEIEAGMLERRRLADWWRGWLAERDL